MKNSTTGSRTKRRFVRLLTIIVAATASMMALMAVPALAETGMKCHPVPESNVCLSFWQLDSNHYQVKIGIDFHIGLQRAQQIIDQPGDPFVARIFGIAKEPVGKQPMFTVPMTDIGASEEFGLGAEFIYVATRDQLNDDPFPWPFDFRRLMGRIELIPGQGGPTLTFETGSFAQNF